MPTLSWIGKEAVVNHHREVPFHLLKDVPKLSCGDPGAENLIVQGDNLVALKALLPYYAGQVKCICQLLDGRILAVEYKGSNLYDASDAAEKRAVGAVWAGRSGGRCLFVMPTGRDFSVIEAAIG